MSITSQKANQIGECTDNHTRPYNLLAVSVQEQNLLFFATINVDHTAPAPKFQPTASFLGPGGCLGFQYTAETLCDSIAKTQFSSGLCL